MAKQSYVISGTIGYAFVTPDNLSYTFNDNGNYVVKLYPDEASLKTIEDLGGLHLLREPGEKDSGPFVNLSRNSLKPIFTADGKLSGEYTKNSPPIIYGLPDGAKIGSGSSATVQFHTYTGKGRKTYFELEGLRIDELKEFVPTGGEKVDLLRIVE